MLEKKRIESKMVILSRLDDEMSIKNEIVYNVFHFQSIFHFLSASSRLNCSTPELA